MSNGFEQIDIEYVDISDDDDQPSGALIVWGIKGFGFGETTFYYKDRVLRCSNETLSVESVKKILCALADKAIFDS